MRLTRSGGDADRVAQEVPRLQRRADEPIERFAARILEQQRCSAAFAGKREYAQEIWNAPFRPCA